MNLSDIDALLIKVQEHQQIWRSKLIEIRSYADALLKAARAIGASWSGSNFGYHGELYYGNFQKPPLGDRFSVEWGGVNGLPPGWKARTADEVKQRIESLAGVEIARVEGLAEELIDSAKTLQTAILIVLAPLQEATGLAKEKDLLTQLESIDWSEKVRDKYCIAALQGFPSATRDSEAIMQGSMVPSHTYYEGVAEQGCASCSTAEEFWKLTERLLKQLQIQAQARQRSSLETKNSVFDLVVLICRRLHAVALQLKNRRQNRATLTIEDEYDVQDLLSALLRIHFDDVRPEEPTPSFGGGAARMDFLLKKERMVIEAKMTRTQLRDKEVCEEIIKDVARYKNHNDCSKLVCLIYDPEGLMRNPHGVANDIRKLSSESLDVEAIIVPER